MNNLQVFNNKDFGEVRAITIENIPFFVGKDVANALGYSNERDAILRHVDDEDKKAGVVFHDGRQNRQVTVINESGLYSLILSSKLTQAKKFKRWVTSEVLPSIRKNGGYIQNQDELDDDELIAKALSIATRKIAERDKKIEMLKPKALFADSVSASKISILIGELAKILKGNGINIGQNRLFKWLRDNGYLIRRKGTDYNTPTQRGMELELFEIKETVISHSDGHTSISKTTKVTGKGQIYFINKFLAKEEM